MINQFMSKLSDKEKKVLYITILIVGLAALDRLLIAPGLESLKSSNDEIAKQEKIIKADLRVLNNKENINAREEVYSKFYQDKVEANDVVNRGLLSTIERIATKSKITITKSNPTDIKKQKRTIEYYANLDCTGGLENMISFMHAINSSDDLLKIIRFDLLPKKGTENEVSASMSVVKLVMGQGNMTQDK